LGEGSACALGAANGGNAASAVEVSAGRGGGLGGGVGTFTPTAWAEARVILTGGCVAALAVACAEGLITGGGSVNRPPNVLGVVD